MRSGYFIDTLTSVDIRETVKLGGKISKIYEGVHYWENFKTSPFTEVFETLFVLRLKCKDEGYDIIQKLVKLLLNNLYGENILKAVTEEYRCK